MGIPLEGTRFFSGSVVGINIPMYRREVCSIKNWCDLSV